MPLLRNQPPSLFPPWPIATAPWAVSPRLIRPYRYRVRAPSFINLTLLEDMCLGHSIAGTVVILGSVLGEVNR